MRRGRDGGIDPAARRAVPADAAAVRDVRLQALAEASEAFGSTLAREAGRTLEEWERWLGGAAVFLLEAEGVPRGLAAGVRHVADPTAVFLEAVWVHPMLRGTGAADVLVTAVLAWAADAGHTVMWLHVGAPNVPARRCYERHGFVATGETFVRERDGMVEVEMRRPVVDMPPLLDTHVEVLRKPASYRFEADSLHGATACRSLKASSSNTRCGPTSC